MIKRKSTTNQYFRWQVAGYILLTAWVLLLAITDYSSWSANYHKIFGHTYSPLSAELGLIIFFVPIILIAVPLSYSQIKPSSSTTIQERNFSWIVNFVVIIALSWFFYFLLQTLFHGLF